MFILYDVLDVCQFIVAYCNDKNYSITNLRLQKMLYFMQLYFLDIKGKLCFKNPLEAWQLGPVSPDAYFTYCSNGANEIPNYPVENNKVSPIGKDDQEIIKAVLDKVSQFSTWQLVDITHHQMPWKKNYLPYARNEIPSKDLKIFVEKVKNAKK